MQYSVQTAVNRLTVLAVLLLLPIQAAHSDVTVTQLANEGVILSDGITKIMIDGMVTEPYSIYGGLPPDVTEQFFKAEGPFADIDLVLVSHQHHDHNQPVSGCKFVQNSDKTLFVTSSQVMDLMREKCRQHVTTDPEIRVIDPQYGQPETIVVGDAKVTVFLLTHGGGKYAILQNFGQLVEMGGMRVLHVGDAAMEPDDYARAGVDQMDVDVALIPFWYFQPGPGGDIVRRFMDTPYKIAVHIPPGEMEEVKEYMQVEYPDVLILEKPLDQVTFTPVDPLSETAPPPP